jgi:diguanylate cyclase (GGDEF)-like protein
MEETGDRRNSAHQPGEYEAGQQRTSNSPAFTLAAVIAIVFVSEYAVAAFLSLMPPLSPWLKVFLKAALLIILLVPLLYVYPFRQMAKRITDLKQKERELEALSFRDFLTGAYNRTKFEVIILREMERARRYDRILTLILFDLDRFKNVNDSYGYIAGDHVLKAVAAIIIKNIRKADYIVRWEGEEFIVLTPEIECEGAKIQAERIRRAIENYSVDKVISVTVSAGLAQFRPDDTEDSLIRRANNALNKAKVKGMNRVESEQ